MKPRASKKYLYFASVVEHSRDGMVLMFHLQRNWFAFNGILSQFVNLNKIEEQLFLWPKMAHKYPPGPRHPSYCQNS